MSEHHFNRRILPASAVPGVLTHKWSYEVMNEGYTPLPKRLLRCLSQIFTDLRDLQTILAVIDFDRPNLTRLPSLDYLAFIAGLSVEQFRERMNHLKDEGLLHFKGPDDGLEFNTEPLRQKIVALTGGYSGEEPTGGEIPF